MQSHQCSVVVLYSTHIHQKHGTHAEWAARGEKGREGIKHCFQRHTCFSYTNTPYLLFCFYYVLPTYKSKLYLVLPLHLAFDFRLSNAQSETLDQKIWRGIKAVGLIDMSTNQMEGRKFVRQGVLHIYQGVIFPHYEQANILFSGKEKCKNMRFISGKAQEKLL